MRVHVLQDHLFLLQRLEAADSDVPSGRFQHPVDGCGQVPAPPLSLAPGLDPASLDHPGQQVPGLRLGPLGQPRQLCVVDRRSRMSSASTWSSETPNGLPC